MDLSTTYLGLELKSPVLLGASPLSADLEAVQEAELAGAGAIVLNSLFEEQLEAEQHALHAMTDGVADSHGEASSYFPEYGEYGVCEQSYLDHLSRVKAAVKIPVIASLNGTSAGGWVQHAKQMEEAGADALELNLYYLPTNPLESGAEVEQRYLDTLVAVKSAVSMPVAVKLSPYFSSPVHMAARLADAGAAGVVLFNRLLQPDLDIEGLKAESKLSLSDSSELLLRIRWLAAMHGQVPVSLSASGGVHRTEDVIKALMAGADTVQMVSALLKHGAGYIGPVINGLREWLIEHEYTSLRQMIGSLSMGKVPNPQAFERTQYLKLLQSWGR